ncbi:CCAAT-binding transcription factor (CBF-B/NF-YA) subunit B-domain-containing protein [Corynascus novoguineensis]|uniref:Transcriptional activator HAP2 n=1 Tax=Corynascus novoguineensis TaxID=1126955 RepID=A0AAN7CKR4_9PEZI|nr:CCAAT-binding transcription factor (CBF-B/NF-YA) subunit B-domain-containing protein [Corynascus novoguineensis]
MGWSSWTTQPPPVEKLEEAAHGITGIPSNAPPSTPRQHRPATPCHKGQTTVTEESTFYVNKKQFHRILKRRALRDKLGWEATVDRSRPYLHESRHNHARRRPRGPKGRFLTAEELATLRAESTGAASEQGKEARIDNKGMEEAVEGAYRRRL